MWQAKARKEAKPGRKTQKILLSFCSEDFYAFFVHFSRWEIQVKKETVDWFFKLAVIGTLAASASIVLPWLGVDSDLLSSSGEIAGGLASAFGLAVAAIALRLYVWSESPEKKKIDRISEQIDVVNAKLTLLFALERGIIMHPGHGYVGDEKKRVKQYYVTIARQIAQDGITSELCLYMESVKKGGQDIANRFQAGAMLLKDDGSDLIEDKNTTEEKYTNAAKLFYPARKELYEWISDQSHEEVLKNIAP